MRTKRDAAKHAVRAANAFLKAVDHPKGAVVVDGDRVHIEMCCDHAVVAVAIFDEVMQARGYSVATADPGVQNVH